MVRFRGRGLIFVKMKKALTFGVIAIIILFLAGCALETPKAADGSDEIVCGENEIRFGEGCCIDEDSNQICDDDEAPETPEEEQEAPEEDDEAPEQEAQPEEEPEEQKPEKIVLPMECSMIDEWECQSVVWKDGDFQITLKNKETNAEGIKVSLDGIGCYDVYADDGFEVLDYRENATYSGFAGCNPKVGTFDLKLKVEYLDEDSSERTSSGIVTVVTKEVYK